MRLSGTFILLADVILFSLISLEQSAFAQKTSIRGKIETVGPRGITLVPSEEEEEDAQPLFVGANRQTQVRMNVLATPDRIQQGAYVQMRVLWDGQSALRATSIKFPEGRATRFGLFKG